MLRSTVLRSGSSRAIKRWMAPAPRSKPSRTTYAVSMKATSAYQAVCIATLGRADRVARARRRGTFHDQSLEEEDERQPEDGVDAQVPEQREPRAARGDEV